MEGKTGYRGLGLCFISLRTSIYFEMSGFFRIIILVFLTRLTDSFENTSSKLDVIDSCDVPHSRDLVHPFLKQLQKVNRQRYKDFDEEDMNTYIEVKCFENIRYLHFCKMILPSFDTDKKLLFQGFPPGYPCGGLREGQVASQG